jgi:hypothetical protein
MDYLTNYYRNLCEQLQEKLNILEAQLNERYMGDTPIDPNWMKGYLGGGGADKSKRIPTEFVKPSYIPRRDQPYVDQNKQPEKRRQLNPGYKYGLSGEPVYVGDRDIPLIGERLPDDLLKKLKGAGEETDEDIYAMRQTAVDQGGLPQSTVDAPIRRTEQMPDGTLIYGQTPARVRVQPKIGGAGPMKPKNPPFRPQGLGDNALKALDSVKTIPGVQTGEMTYGIVPKYGDRGMINSIDKVDQLGKLDQHQINLNRIPEQERGAVDNVFNYLNKKAVNLFSR